MDQDVETLVKIADIIGLSKLKSKFLYSYQ